MKRIQEVFQRYEKKYILNPRQLEAIDTYLQKEMEMDQYGKHMICNIYFDTKDYEVIRSSIEKPAYKEKLRLRSYGIPKPGDQVFLELKKKYQGIVYKRRVPMTLKTAEEYLYRGNYPKENSQILREVDFAFKRNRIVPGAYLSYERIALFGKEDENLRITFDNNILCRQTSLYLEKGSYGVPLFTSGETLMEIKIPGSMPLWMSRLLSELEIFPVSFSKYGTFYKEYMMGAKERKGGEECA